MVLLGTKTTVHKFNILTNLGDTKKRQQIECKANRENVTLSLKINMNLILLLTVGVIVMIYLM